MIWTNVISIDLKVKTTTYLLNPKLDVNIKNTSSFLTLRLFSYAVSNRTTLIVNYEIVWQVAQHIA